MNQLFTSTYTHLCKAHDPPPILTQKYTLKLSKTERPVIITEVYLYWEEGSQLKKNSYAQQGKYLNFN